jgi:hypothetical protein
VGVLILLAGWVLYLWRLWTVRAGIRYRWLLSVLAAGGLAITAWSIVDDRGSWWIAGAALAVVAQLAAGLSTLVGDHAGPLDSVA